VIPESYSLEETVTFIQHAAGLAVASPVAG